LTKEGANVLGLVGLVVGVSVEGASEGERVGPFVGLIETDGARDGGIGDGADVVGVSEGVNERVGLKDMEGAVVGVKEGKEVDGVRDGDLVGFFVGLLLGLYDGVKVGALVGVFVGLELGAKLGVRDGDEVGVEGVIVTVGAAVGLDGQFDGVKVVGNLVDFKVGEIEGMAVASDGWKLGK